MKILDIRESRERCAESGWFAYDFILEKNVNSDLIMALKPLGAMTYLPMLKKPFFKVEANYYFLKGMDGDDFIRVAVHDKHREELDMVKAFIEDLSVFAS